MKVLAIHGQSHLGSTYNVSHYLLDNLDDCEVFETEEVLETSELQSIKERINNHTYQILLHYYYQILKEKWRKKKNRSNC